MKALLIGLCIIGSASTYAQTQGRDLIREGTRTHTTPTELKNCIAVEKKYSVTIEKLERIRSVNVSILTEQEKIHLNEAIDEISIKRQTALDNGAMNLKCSLTLNSKVEELLSLKVEYLAPVTERSAALTWAKEIVIDNCKAINGTIVGNISCEKVRDGASYPNQHGGQTNELPIFECSQVCRVNSKL